MLIHLFSIQLFVFQNKFIKHHYLHLSDAKNTLPHGNF